MRYYTIQILDSTNGNVVKQFSSIDPFSGSTLPGALNIELDIPIYTYDAPAGYAYVRVWGIALTDIGQSSNFNGKTVRIFAGMAKGLPLANPAQAGLIAQGKIFQAFGNWQGVNQTLDFVFYADTGSADAPQNLVTNWTAGMLLSTAISNTLQTAFPTYKQSINISSNLVLSHDEPGVYQSLGQFASHINTISRSIVGGSYSGVRMLIRDNTFLVYDGTTPTTPKPIVFTDIIGQPVWKDLATIGIYCVLRSDIQVGDYISLPQSQVTTTAQSYSAFRNSLVFQGSFLVTRVRHVGNFRDPDAASWVTVIDATSVQTDGSSQNSAGASAQ
ncbi:hypothetical protein AB4Y43_01420 [Paraburkholderia sp. BR10872]|uniref:hypothetical protein n=1 Tax=Paraburkholderia sp. BR10872 TaxID=3236989 RepID=UPI0034D2BB07